MRYVAFDLGASSGKLFEGTLKDGRLSVEPLYGFPNGIIQLKDGLYWDVMRIYQELCTGLQRAEARGGVDSLGIDSYNNDFSLIDANGELLMPLRSYRDPRTQKHWDEIFSRKSQREVYMYTGNQIAPFNTLMQLAAMNLSGQHFMLENAHRLLMLPDLLAYYITGETGIEYTLAAETELMELSEKKWIGELFDVYDIPLRLMPELKLPGNILGRSTEAFNRMYGLKGFDYVNVCGHDTASAFLASPLGRDAVLISSGTWALVGVEHDRPVVNDVTYENNIANEGGPDGHHRILRNVMGSWLIQELRRDIARDGREPDFAEIQRLALSAKPFAFPIDPDDASFYLPGNMREKIRAVSLRTNGRAPETPAEFFRCVYEALVMKYRYCVELMEQVTGRRYASVNIIGGGSQDALCNQMTANATGRRVVAGPVDASSIGNIIVQMIAHGELQSIEQAREAIARSFELKTYEPEDSAVWNEMYGVYRELFVKG